jgi:hypothetical protein
MDLSIFVLVIAAGVIGAIVLHVGGAMLWGKVLGAIDRRFPKKENK